MITGPTRSITKLEAAILDTPCPMCGSQAGWLCRTKDGKDAFTPHLKRIVKGNELYNRRLKDEQS
jgi:hypothetical protein